MLVRVGLVPLLRVLSVVASGFVAVFVAAGCRGCGDSGGSDTAQPALTHSSSGPLMPPGMLSPAPDAATAPPARDIVSLLTLSRSKAGSDWIELQEAGPNDPPDRKTFDRGASGSRFLSVDAMTLLHSPFARALPGFDLFLPRLFAVPALARLRDELAAMKREVAATSALAEAKTHWASVSPLIGGLSSDATWVTTRATLLQPSIKSWKSRRISLAATEASGSSAVHPSENHVSM